MQTASAVSSGVKCCRVQDVLFELAETGELLVQGPDRLQAGQRPAGPPGRPAQGRGVVRAQDDIVERQAALGAAARNGPRNHGPMMPSQNTWYPQAA